MRPQTQLETCLLTVGTSKGCQLSNINEKELYLHATLCLCYFGSILEPKGHFWTKLVAEFYMQKKCKKKFWAML